MQVEFLSNRNSGFSRTRFEIIILEYRRLTLARAQYSLFVYNFFFSAVSWLQIVPFPTNNLNSFRNFYCFPNPPIQSLFTQLLFNFSIIITRL